MEQLINVRQHMIGFYKKFEVAINYIAKFFIGLFVFSRINALGMFREEFNVLFGNSGTQMSYVALMALLFTISPPSIAMFLITVAIAIQLSAVLEVAFFVFLLLVLLIVFYARLAPRESVLILAMVMGFYFRMPYAVVLIAGLYFGITSMIPVILGTAVWYFFPFFTNLAATVDVVTDFDLLELPITFMEVFAQIFSQLTTDFNWIVLGFVFAMIVLATHLISRISINYNKDIAIGVGTIVGMICMTMVVLVIDIDMSVGGIFLSSIASALLVWIVKFFEGVQDYKRVERVAFDDDDNYYYVKIVPKVTAEQGPAPVVNKPQRPPKKPSTKPGPKSGLPPYVPPPPGYEPGSGYKIPPGSRTPSGPTRSGPAGGPPSSPLTRTETGYRGKFINTSMFNDDE